ncbi:hypothetical protein QTI24_12490 [Variovorax sp. J22P240]|uniref:hypothetical protein n=1 Tax=Variovorax sp. J22P240 TaxID=3053514 RepID=UPI0025789A87|nr:hypothetical protein [Variovorax sp. J22P240]MDL9999429.1 hypothetical protein [Variovorax sp. J22P240]
MSITALRFTGPDSAPCVLGAPIFAYYGEIHVGTLDPVPVSRGGTEVRIQHYTPSSEACSHALQKLRIGRVLLLELVAFIATHFSSVSVISFVLNRDIEGYGNGIRLAGSRSALLQSIGAEHIVITPKPKGERAGHFAVAAFWQYNVANLSALNAATQAEWAAFRERETAALPGKAPRANAWLRRFLSHRARNGSARRPGH